VAVAAATTDVALGGAKAALEADVAVPLLFGDGRRIAEGAEKLGWDLTGVEVVDEPDDVAATVKAVAAVREGQADILAKGQVHTDDFLRAILDAANGLRAGVLMSHVFILEAPALGRLLFVTDGAMNIAPDLEQKAQIVLNAVYLARVFGVEEPKVGAVAAVEVVNPKMPATLDAAALAAMETRGQFPYCVVDGPFGLDNAVSPEAAAIKGLSGPVPGCCDILLAPDIEAGNMAVKAFAFLGGGKVAGVLVGAAAPVVLTSRADPAEARLHSLAAAVLMAGMARDGRLRVGKLHY
jgi:phosphate butyryltransferase